VQLFCKNFSEIYSGGEPAEVQDIGIKKEYKVSMLT
jgi:hypothetical protein